MDAQPATAALAQDGQIALRLGGLHDPDAELLSGYGHVLWIVARDLNEDAVGWSAFVRLTGRMQAARAESEAGRSLGSIADEFAVGVEHRFVLRGHLDVGE